MSIQFTATVDEVGPDSSGTLLATLITDDGVYFQLPVSMLPENVDINHVISITLESDLDETARRKHRIQKLQHRLFGTR